MQRPAREIVLASVLLAVGLASWLWRAAPSRLAIALEDPDPLVQRGAAQALGEAGAAAAWAVPQLVQMLANEVLASAAAFALGQIGAPARAAVPALAACARARDPILLSRVAVALLRIAPQDAQAQAAIALVRSNPVPIVRKLASPER